MKTFYRYAAVLAGSVIGLWACTADKEEAATGGKAAIDQPQVLVSELTTSGFTLRWNAVENAGSYRYTFNDGEETEITDRQISFSDLERQKEYVVAIKALPKFANEYTESPYTYVHVVTDDLEQLPKPEITLGCAYASKTIVSWTEVPEAAAYEYTIGAQTYTTSERTIAISGLEKSREYTIAVRAMTGDATRFTNSEAAELSFTTSDGDVPTLLIAPTHVISDAVEFQIYATSDQTYYYEVMAASTFAKYDPATIAETYRKAILDYAASQDVSIQLVLASMLKSGTQTLQLTGLTSELSYVIFAFGMDLKGNITTDLCATTFRTTAEGYSDGPNYGGSDWFQQNFYITNAYAGITGYGWTNSVWTNWAGQDVARIRYRTLPTDTFRQIFPDENDTAAITAFLKEEDYAYEAEEAILTLVNSGGSMSVTPAGAGTSYTLAALATSSGGEETLCVNSVTTKASEEALSWFLADAATNAAYGPTYSTVAGVMKGVDVAKVRICLFETAALQGVPTSQYADVVANRGTDLPAEYIAYINGNGFALIYNEQAGIRPSTSYTFLATATNSVGDTTTKWGTATTTAAPDAGTTSVATTRAGGSLQSLVGEPIPNPERFIYPYRSKSVSKETKAEGDYWTIIHNMQILK